jgi:taurine dioxygenase
VSFYQDYNDKLAFEQWNTRARPDYRHITVKPLSPALGAEVSGIDLRQALSADQLAELHQAIADNLVLVFREQPIDAEQHKRFARQFGRLHQHLLTAATAGEAERPDPEIRAWHTGKSSRHTAGEVWHSDSSCDPEPIWLSLLRITRLPENGGGDTAFANLYLAYEALSDPIKALLENLTAVHDASIAWVDGYGAKEDPEHPFPKTEHPVVARHPLTGRKFLFVNSAFTSHIVGLTRSESDALLQLLFRHIERHLSLQTRIQWQENSLVLWDNWATQHHAVWDYYPFERAGQRVSVVPEHGPRK